MKKTPAALVGLDIEAGSIAATEVEVNGAARVSRAAVAPLEEGAFLDGEVRDRDRLAGALKEFFSAHKLSKRVRLGVGNQGVVVRVLRLPAIEDPKAMEAAVRFQAGEQMPMPLDQAVLQHQVVGGVPGEEGAPPQVDVIVVAARRKMVASFVDPIRDAGLEPVGIDLSAFGMIRALSGSIPVEEASGAGPGERPSGAVLYASVGDVTNLAVARADSCLFTRVSDAGLEAATGHLRASLSLIPEHATQWLHHVGLERPVDSIEGDPEIVARVREVLEEGVAGLQDDLRLSLDYYGAQEGALPVERIVFCGPGSAIPGLPERVREGLGLPVLAPRPAALGEFDPAVAARLTLPYGLALEG